MSAPTLRPDPTVEVAEHDGQVVKLWRPEDIDQWWVLGPDDVNGGGPIGPFALKELALAVAACHFSWGEAF